MKFDDGSIVDLHPAGIGANGRDFATPPFPVFRAERTRCYTYTPEADAVVSTGSRNRAVELPAPERLIGPYDNVRILNYPGAPIVPARGALSLDALDMIIGGIDLWGGQCFTYAAF